MCTPTCSVSSGTAAGRAGWSNGGGSAGRPVPMPWPGPWEPGRAPAALASPEVTRGHPVTPSQGKACHRGSPWGLLPYPGPAVVRRFTPLHTRAGESLSAF